MTAVDLDTLLSEPRRATICGREYLFPAELSCDTAERVVLLQGRLDRLLRAEAPDNDLSKRLFREMYEEVLALAKILQPELEQLPITNSQLYWFFRAVYAGQAIEAVRS